MSGLLSALPFGGDPSDPREIVAIAVLSSPPLRRTKMDNRVEGQVVYEAPAIQAEIVELNNAALALVGGGVGEIVVG